jgi:hypothetical protein
MEEDKKKWAVQLSLAFSADHIKKSDSKKMQGILFFVFAKP